MTSSTSNSSAGFPSGIAVALVLLAALEIGLRFVNPLQLLPYELGWYSLLSSRVLVQSSGPPEVVVVGSSRTQYSILGPLLSEELQDRSGRPTTVGNFGVGGGHSMEIEPMLRFLLRRPEKPRLIVYGLTIEQVSFDTTYNERSTIFWNLSDWARARGTFGSDMDELLPYVIRSSATEYSFLMRYRRRPTVLLHDLHRGHRLGNPLTGGLVAGHTDPELMTTTIDVTDDLRRNVAQHIETEHLVDGVYPMNPAKLELVENVLRECVDAGIGVVLFEVPNSPLFDEYLPPGTASGFNEIARELAEEIGATFYSLADLGIHPTADEFRDTVHLNTAGATRLTRALAARLPELREQ